MGRPRCFKGDRSIDVQHMAPVTDFNHLTLHLLSTISAHILAQKSPASPPPATTPTPTLSRHTTAEAPARRQPPTHHGHGHGHGQHHGHESLPQRRG